MIGAVRAASMAALVLTLATACDDRQGARPLPAAATSPSHVPQIPLVPGMTQARAPMANPFDGDDAARAEGERLYQWFNCVGCHFEGGGGIGPPFLDADWIYGGQPGQVFDSIASGRANGMPAYGGKLTIEQIWQLVAYVRSLERPIDQSDTSGTGRASSAVQAERTP